MTQPIVILGTHTFAEEIADVVSEAPDFTVDGFVENMDRSRCDQPLNGLPVYWVDQLPQLAATHHVVCGLGTTHRSQFTDQAESAGMVFANVAHPSSHRSATSSLAGGCILGIGAIVANHACLGRHVCVNRAASIGHHTRIDEFVTVGPGTHIAGNCHVGPKTYLGIGATVIDHVNIGEQCVIGAGAVVMQDLPDRVMAIGNPARIVRRDVEGK